MTTQEAAAAAAASGRQNKASMAFGSRVQQFQDSKLEFDLKLNQVSGQS